MIFFRLLVLTSLMAGPIAAAALAEEAGPTAFRGFNHAVEILPQFDLFEQSVPNEYGIGVGYEKLSPERRNLVVSAQATMVDRSSDDIRNLRKDFDEPLKVSGQTRALLVGLRSYGAARDSFYFQALTGVLRTTARYDVAAGNPDDQPGLRVDEKAWAVPLVLGAGFRYLSDSGWSATAGMKFEMNSVLTRQLETINNDVADREARDAVRQLDLATNDATFQFGVGRAF